MNKIDHRYVLVYSITLRHIDVRHHEGCARSTVATMVIRPSLNFHLKHIA